MRVIEKLRGLDPKQLETLEVIAKRQLQSGDVRRTAEAETLLMAMEEKRTSALQKLKEINQKLSDDLRRAEKMNEIYNRIQLLKGVTELAIQIGEVRAALGKDAPKNLDKTSSTDGLLVIVRDKETFYRGRTMRSREVSWAQRNQLDKTTNDLIDAYVKAGVPQLAMPLAN